MTDYTQQEVQFPAVYRNGVTVQVLGVDDSTHQRVSLGAAAVRVDLSTQRPRIRVIEINLSEAAYIALGDGTVTATTGDRYLPAGSYYYRLLGDQTHISLLEVSGAGGIASVTAAR